MAVYCGCVNIYIYKGEKLLWKNVMESCVKWLYECIYQGEKWV